MQLDEKFWDERYLTGNTGWDIGYVSTPLKEYFDQIEDKSKRILIPGCGNAYEAEYLLNAGFTDIHVIDISEKLVNDLRKKLEKWNDKNLKVFHGDFFDHKGEYDLIIEQTFFCAIDPALRPAYAKKMAELLTVGGKLVGLLFNTVFEKEGPPFGGIKEEYIKCFQPYFNILKMEEAYNSITPRMGKELFIILAKK